MRCVRDQESAILLLRHLSKRSSLQKQSRDFNEGNYVAQQTLPMDDGRFMTKVKQGITYRSDGHYGVLLPL